MDTIIREYREQIIARMKECQDAADCYENSAMNRSGQGVEAALARAVDTQMADDMRRSAMRYADELRRINRCL